MLMPSRHPHNQALGGHQPSPLLHPRKLHSPCTTEIPILQLPQRCQHCGVHTAAGFVCWGQRQAVRLSHSDRLPDSNQGHVGIQTKHHGISQTLALRCTGRLWHQKHHPKKEIQDCPVWIPEKPGQDALQAPGISPWAEADSTRQEHPNRSLFCPWLSREAGEGVLLSRAETPHQKARSRH